MGDGHLGKCKECTKRDAREVRAANLDYYRAYDKNRSTLPHRVELRDRIFAAWRMAHPDRRKAHNAVWAALRAGKIVKLPCWVCGAKAEAHHPDYSSPLDVVWLCRAHHMQAHSITEAA